MQKLLVPFLSAAIVVATIPVLGADRPELLVGLAGHAFDHLGNIDAQARAAVMSGATIIYGTGFGALGYGGLPVTEKIEEAHRTTKGYLAEAKRNGLQLAFGYVCATSMVKLETFDRNWPKEFHAQFSSPPSDWLQQDQDGKALPSWYGGEYRPACMNNPDWRAYEKFIVRQQIEAGFDGIFFDNPTVHAQGCFCRYCMTEFSLFLFHEGGEVPTPTKNSLDSIRKLAKSQPRDFMRFRCTIAANFLTEMGNYARTLKRDALITANNSLNAPEAFFAQSRTNGYNIFELSKAEDLVVVEDMANQPRLLADGRVAEYGPIYEMIAAISHRKPIIAATIADADYHTPPSLVRLAMAEAAAHNASYLGWPTWPEEQRMKMISGIRPQANFLKQYANLLNDTAPAGDTVLFLPVRQYTETADCQPMKVARALGAANVQFDVVSEEDFAQKIKVKNPPVWLIESPGSLIESETGLLDAFKRRGGKVIWTENANWLDDLQATIDKPSLKLQGPATVRAVVRDLPKKRIVH
ncbi:MAG: putative glycoside hydrolase, partial [Verrucomicrobiota bacterium]